jgi:ribosomal protein S18 acetylase RimI-like enzyme
MADDCNGSPQRAQWQPAHRRIMRPMQPRIRPATVNDQRAIWAWVWRSGLNPLNLNWRNFVVAEVEGQLAGFGQLRPHRDGSLELASLVVRPAYRRQGIGSRIVRALLAGQQGPIYTVLRKQVAVVLRADWLSAHP